MGFNLLHYKLLTHEEVNAQYGGLEHEFKFKFSDYRKLNKLALRFLPSKFNEHNFSHYVMYPYHYEHDHVVVNDYRLYYYLRQWLNKCYHDRLQHVHYKDFINYEQHSVVSHIKNISVQQVYFLCCKPQYKNYMVSDWITTIETGTQPYFLFNGVGNLRKPTHPAYKEKYRNVPYIVPTMDFLINLKETLIKEEDLEGFQKTFIDNFVEGKSLIVNSF